MKFDEFIKLIRNHLIDRFAEESQSEAIDAFYMVAPKELINKLVIRIQRNNVSNLENFKTILVVERSTFGDLRKIMEWTGLVRDLLLNPELSDLYLFIINPDEINVSLDECLRIEATEELCRKYVLRPGEDGEDFIRRTFLMPTISTIEKQLGADPLTKAFQTIESIYPWFNEEEKQKWKEAFLSGLTGTELIDKIF